MKGNIFCRKHLCYFHKSITLCAVVFLCSFLWVVSAHATTFTVTSLEDDGSSGTLRYLIEHGASDGDTVVVPSGIYILDKHKGAIDVDKNLTIKGQDQNTTIIDGNGERSDDRIFNIDNLDRGVGVVIQTLTIKNGMSHHDGGAIDVKHHGALQLEHVTVSYNESRESGGAIVVSGEGSLVVGQSLITRNKARHDGGGIYNRDGSVIIAQNSIISYNEAGSCGERKDGHDDFIMQYQNNPRNGEDDEHKKCGYGGGGGIFTEDGGTEVLESEVSHNMTGKKAGDGGGIENDSSALFLRNCKVLNNWAVSGEGGGLANHYVAQVNNCTFSQNQAEDNHDGDDLDYADFHINKSRHRHDPRGGAIYTDEQLTMVNSLVDQNFATEDGGGIYNHDSLSLLNTVISHNVAGFDEACEVDKCGKSYDQGAGGGVYSASEMHVRLSTINANSANKGPGGGLYIDGTATIDMSTVSNNTAVKDDGGGIYSEGNPVVITDSTVSGNRALGIHPCTERDFPALGWDHWLHDVDSRGGGIWVDEPMDISNSTIAQNAADGDGGGIYNEADLQMNYNTIVVNTADANGGGVTGGDGGGIANFHNVAFANTIIALNVDHSPGMEAPDCFSEFILAGHTMNSNGPNIVMNPLNCEITGNVSHVTNVDPHVDPALLKNNGGPTKTVALLSGSPAINSADLNNCLPTDQRGVNRPVGPACDIGAYEFGGNICGNGEVENGEECDHGTLNGTPGNTCSATCQNIVPSCGNGVVESGEECDHGSSNGSPGDLCSATCQIIIPNSGGNDNTSNNSNSVQPEFTGSGSSGSDSGVAGSGCMLNLSKRSGQFSIFWILPLLIPVAWRFRKNEG